MCLVGDLKGKFGGHGQGSWMLLWSVVECVWRIPWAYRAISGHEPTGIERARRIGQAIHRLFQTPGVGWPGDRDER